MDLLSVKAGMETQHNHLGLVLETVLHQQVIIKNKVLHL